MSIIIDEKLYPYLNDHISFRLSEEKVQLRNLRKRVDTIIDLNGSVCLFIKEMDGLTPIKQVFARLCESFNDVGIDIIRKDYSDILDKLIQQDIIALSECPIDKRKKGLGIVAQAIRSSVHFDITHKCNEACIHCLVDKNNIEADTEDIVKVLYQAAQLGFTSCAFSGGEPTIHPDFYRIITIARDLGFYFTLFTNAISLSDKDVHAIASCYPEKVRISLYAMDPNIHDQITTIPGSFERTMRGIQLFKDAGLHLFINIPIMALNYHGYRKIADFCDNNGFERSLDPVIQPTRDRRDRKMYLQLDYQQAKEVTGFQQSADVLVANVKDGNIVCNAGADPSIDACLNVYPCPGIRRLIGNLKTSTLEQIIDNSFIAELQSLKLDKLGKCQSCLYLDGCYRCHGHAWQQNESIYDCSWSDKRQAKIRQELMIERRLSKSIIS